MSLLTKKIKQSLGCCCHKQCGCPAALRYREFGWQVFTEYPPLTCCFPIYMKVSSEIICHSKVITTLYVFFNVVYDFNWLTLAESLYRLGRHFLAGAVRRGAAARWNEMEERATTEKGTGTDTEMHGNVNYDEDVQARTSCKGILEKIYRILPPHFHKHFQSFS